MRAPSVGPIVLVLIGWAAASLLFTASVGLRYAGTDKNLLFVLYANAVRCGGWALVLPLLVRAVRRFPLHRGRRLPNGAMLLITTLVAAPIVSLSSLGLIFSTFFPYRERYATFGSVLTSELSGFFNADLLTGAMLVIGAHAWIVWRELETERRRAAVLEGQLVSARLETLRAQLHPHFLFNTLHTISGLITEDPATARRMVVDLGELLRLTLDDRTAPLVTLARELQVIDRYMAIHKLRLADRLMVDYDIEPGTTAAEVPYLLLQPLFENAVRHGAGRLAGGCAVTFAARRGGEWLQLTLENDAPRDAAAPAPSGHGLGLSQTEARLRLQYGDAFTFRYDRPVAGRARVEVRIPFRRFVEPARDVQPRPHAYAAG